MGRFLSRGPIHFFFSQSFFVRPGKPFLRPDPQSRRAGAHRSRQGWRARKQRHPARALVLDGFEHDGTLVAVVQNGSAASELSLRCASLHHGLGPHPPNTRMWHECSCYHTRAPLGLCHPDHNKCAVMLEPLKDEPLPGWRYAPSLPASARAGSTRLWVGAKKRAARSNKETEGQEMERTLGAPP